MICSNCSQPSVLSLSEDPLQLELYFLCQQRGQAVECGVRENSGLAQYCKTIGGQYLDQSGAALTDWEAISGPISSQHLPILIGSCDCA